MADVEAKDMESAAAHDAEPVRYRPRGRVVPAKEIAAWETGRAYMRAASREAERLKEEAVDAYEDARRRGFEEGRKEGAEAAARLLAETTVLADRRLAEADREIVDLALAVVRRVLGELDVGQATRHAVRHALSRQRQDQHLTLYVAPDMVDDLRADVDALFDSAVRHLITVEPDARLDRADCRLASEVGFVDLGIEAQLNALHKGLADGLKRQAHD
ncbi:MAG: type III secretion system stator protein SctL [Alphaproteobacteria bacterium]